MSLTTAAAMAQHLSVPYQLALWLMRIPGLRVSEAFGLVVANFIDCGERAYLLIER